MAVAIIGLGRMGSHLARHALDGGHETLVWNRSKGPESVLLEAGAKLIADPTEIFHADVVISILFDDAATRSVLLDPAVLRASRPGIVHVCMATISPELAEELEKAARDHDFRYLSVPLFGRPEAAAAAALNMVAAGDQALLTEVRPVLALFGKVWPVGTRPGHANLAKIAGNFMIASAIETMAEAAMTLARVGADQAAFLDMMSHSLFASPIYRTYGPSVSGAAPLPDLGIAIAQKDVGLMHAAAAKMGMNLPFAQALLGQIECVCERGLEHKDMSVALPAVLSSS